jgi:hypothetical protein
MFKFAGVYLLIALAAFAQAPLPQDYVPAELRTYLKLDTQQTRRINSLIGDFLDYASEKTSEYLDLEDQIDSLRRDAKMEPQAIGLALADPTAAQITIERKLDAKIIETEKAVQATLTEGQKILTSQLSVALRLQPLVSDAPLTNAGTSPFQLRSVFGKKLEAARKER